MLTLWHFMPRMNIRRLTLEKCVVSFKERTQCGYAGHTVDKCYKLHGYPPGYKAKQKSTTSSRSGENNTSNYAPANQVIESIPKQPQSSVEDFMQTLNHNKYQHLMNMLNSYLASAKIESGIGIDAHSNKMTGTCFSISVNLVLNSPKHWVVDSGATSHICFNKSAFINMKSAQNTYVTLLNHLRIHWNCKGWP